MCVALQALSEFNFGDERLVRLSPSCYSLDGYTQQVTHTEFYQFDQEAARNLFMLVAQHLTY